MALLFEYTRTTRKEGYLTLSWLAFMGTLTISVPIGFGFHNVSPLLFGLWLFVILSVIIGLGRGAIKEVRSNKAFRMRVYEDRFICESPSPEKGVSFDIHLWDILCVEERQGHRFSEWRLVPTKGKQIVLTGSYGNPISKVIETLRKAKPDLCIRQKDMRTDADYSTGGD